MAYQHIQIPSDGSGIGITPVMRQIVDAAVEKACSGQKRIAWMEGAEKVSCSGSGKAVVAHM